MRTCAEREDCVAYAEPNNNGRECFLYTGGQEFEGGGSKYDKEDYKCLVKAPRLTNGELNKVCPHPHQIWKDSACRNCPDYELALEDGTGCFRQTCDSYEVVLADGTCQKCPDY